MATLEANGMTAYMRIYICAGIADECDGIPFAQFSIQYDDICVQFGASLALASAQALWL